MAPSATLSHLHRPDGSATYTHNGYCIIGAVNGPIEVLRRDELAEEATVEVNVRMAVGVGSPKERHLETVLTNTLRGIILTRRMPRCLVQITLQVHSSAEEHTSLGSKFNSNLLLLPHLLHTSLLSLLSASIPLSTTLTSSLVATTPTSPGPVISPTAQSFLRHPPTALHVFTFSGDRKLLLSESEGTFDHEQWDEACEAAEEVCCKVSGGVEIGEGMEVEGVDENLEEWLRRVVREKVEGEQRWKGAS
ncbi:hypothetical protein GQ43DRAFT_400846 [Delitschia confertaspora ATCC 74209]|uniref:Exoribonuclease phosphorolytic domain-containing protein n=1 Tax=Delitschia confertaspora ATCC 74209 TaxID=1513339 RepID=A0A9P4JKP3_9PLEO|nr:hypothetical protein GQ43DRAFT_400846 [Delitschia confertaspora ATCC 74209]